MKNGYEWTRRYLVWDLDAFMNANLKSDVDYAQLKGVRPHEIRRIRIPPGADVQFPLLEAYLTINDTLKGRQAARERDAKVAEIAEQAAGGDDKDNDEPDDAENNDQNQTETAVVHDKLADLVGPRLEAAKETLEKAAEHPSGSPPTDQWAGEPDP